MSASTNSLFEMLGLVGIGISVVAYLPQVFHLAKEHCSAGVSIRAWWMWLASSLLIGTLALYRHDYVSINLASSSLLSSAAILLLAHRYRGMGCATDGYADLPEAFSIGTEPQHEHGAQL